MNHAMQRSIEQNQQLICFYKINKKNTFNRTTTNIWKTRFEKKDLPENFGPGPRTLKRGSRTQNSIRT